MKQTSVDYYSKEIGRLTSDLITGKIIGKQFVILEIKLLEQAKQMEKEQMEKCYDHATLTYLETGHGDLFEDYFNKTYGGDK